jgi:two-component system, OmpR family, response regulator BaeR
MSVNHRATILIVEDEATLAELEADYLQHAGYQTYIVSDGLQVMPWLERRSPDLIVLDIMLPGLDGLELCRRIRQTSEVPIIMLTARVEEIDRLLGLELGADDYLCKPFSPRELVARVKTILRRVKSLAPTLNPSLQLDASRLQVSIADRHTELTTVEFQLLQVLSQQPGRIFSRNHLMDAIYPDQRIVSDRTIDSHIKKLRKKLDQISPDLEWVHSVYGAGYRFELPRTE